MFFVVDVASVPILGLEACTKFDLVMKVDGLTETVYSKEMVLREYKDVFEGLGCMTQEYLIEIQQDATPVVHPPRRVSFSLHGKMKETLDHIEKKGVTKVGKSADC